MSGHGGIVSDGTTLFMTPHESGDEPYLLASTVAGLPVVIGADRRRAAKLALDKLSPDIFLLDDGYQHLRVHRDLNLLLLDCRRPFGNGRTLPAGLLREPPMAHLRADLVVFTRCGDGIVPPALGVPSCMAMHVLGAAKSLVDGACLNFSGLAGKGIAFAGIADPSNFFGALRARGIDLAATQPFTDHVAYKNDEIDMLVGLKRKTGASFFITTEKDGVKLREYAHRLAPLYVASLEISFVDDQPLLKLLSKVI
jgi:tetraacyldisaccharide 4'-kinase